MKLEEIFSKNDRMLFEEIYGNTATVYHRGDKNKLGHLLNKTYENQSHIDFNSYSKALYTTFNMKSQLNSGSYQFNNMKKTYGDYIIKLAVKGLTNFWFCEFDLYKQFINPNANEKTWIEEQTKKFNIADASFDDKFYWEWNHSDISKYFEKRKMIPNKVKGIVYHGRGDGDCILIYDWTTAVPISISKDEGKTWEKIDKTKATDFRKNFKKNDYVESEKKIKPIRNFVPDSTRITKLENVPKYLDGKFSCSKCRGLLSLEGSPKEVGGNFDCNGCVSLKSLEGSPTTVGGNFDCGSCSGLLSLEGSPKVVEGYFDCGSCSNLKSLEGSPKKVGGFYCDCCENLTSLKGSPEEVNGDFICNENNLITLEGSPKKINGNFHCSQCEELTSLKGSPEEVTGSFVITFCKKLKSLEYAPKKIGGFLNCKHTNITEKQAREYLKNNDCNMVKGDFGNISKEDVLKESYFNY